MKLLKLRMLSLIVPVLIFLSCRTVTDSEVKLVNGFSIGEDTNLFAFKINMDGGAYCTASAITDRIAITSSHCLYNDAHELTSFVEVTLGGQTYSTEEFLPNPEYKDSSAWERRRVFDLALIRFERGTFSSTLKIASTPMRNNTRYSQIGYGKDMRAVDSLRTTKQKGNNLYLTDEVLNGAPFGNLSSEELRSMDGLYFISGALNAESPSEVTNRNTSSNHGDSGGPLFVGDTLFAVNQGSYSSEDVISPTSGQVEKSRVVVAVDLTSEYSVRFFSFAKYSGWNFDF